MENKNQSGIIDNLNTPSVTEVEPLFRLTNVFKPSSKKMIIVGMMLKIISVGLVALGGTLLAMVAIVSNINLLIPGITCNILGLVGGAIGEGLILFTKEEPISSLIRAAEDITLEIPQQSSTTLSTNEPIT